MTYAGFPAPQRGLQLCVVVPARNEAAGIAATLDALCNQVDLAGAPFPPESYEILVLANNCEDDTALVAREVGLSHPEHPLYVCEMTFPPEEANVGRARRWLMHRAAVRLGGFRNAGGIIASTDADTIVAPDWLAAISAEIAEGVDVVGGRTLMGYGGDATDPALRRCHLHDVMFQHLISELETHLDPLAHDFWPRHHQHFGANLATTVDAYLSVGGLPHVSTLEDLAYFKALCGADIRVRHSPRVRVRTSARRDGRVELGLSTQLEEWAGALALGVIPPVEAAADAEARIRERRAWREWWYGERSDPPAVDPEVNWTAVARRFSTFGAFYEETQQRRTPCEFEPVTDAIAALRQLLAELRTQPSLPLVRDSLQEVEPILLRTRASEVA